MRFKCLSFRCYVSRRGLTHPGCVHRLHVIAIQSLSKGKPLVSKTSAMLPSKGAAEARLFLVLAAFALRHTHRNPASTSRNKV